MSLYYMTSVDLAVQRLRVEKLRLTCPLEAFITSCLAEVSHELKVLHKHAKGFKLPPSLLGSYEEPALSFATKLYRSIVAAEAYSLAKEAIAAEKVAKVPSKALEEAAKLRPEQVLEKCFI